MPSSVSASVLQTIAEQIPWVTRVPADTTEFWSVIDAISGTDEEWKSHQKIRDWGMEQMPKARAADDETDDAAKGEDSDAAAARNARQPFLLPYVLNKISLLFDSCN